MAVAFEKVACAQLLRTVSADEVLRVPSLAQGRYHLADDRLVASRTAALLRGVHPLAVHFGRQASQHTIQRRSRINRLRRVASLYRTGNLYKKKTN